MIEYDIVINEDGLLDIKPIKTIGNDADSSGDIYELMYTMRNEYNLDVLDSENAYLISMDFYGIPKAIYHISKGDYKTCNIYNRTIAAFLILTRALRFIIIHNHPDNELKESPQDIGNAVLLKSLGSLFDVSFDGSYIVTERGFVNVEDFDSLQIWEEFEED